MVLVNRLIGIHLNWEPTIRIVKIAIRFSTIPHISNSNQPLGDMISL